MKKVNPRRKPATLADVLKAERIAIATAEAIFLTVMMDKFGMEDRVSDIWREVNKLSGEIKDGRVSLQDLFEVLETEYGINITGVQENEQTHSKKQ